MTTLFRFRTICHRRRRPAGAQRRGLTLLEVLIAAILMAALLVALWRMIGIYTSLREKGDIHADNVGNVSVMLQQLEDDLRSIPDVRANPDPSAIAAIPENQLDEAPITVAENPIAVAENSDDASMQDAPPEPDLSEWQPDDNLHHEPVTASAEPEYPSSSGRELARTESVATVTSEQPAPCCLYGDGTSLTLTHLNCDTSQRTTAGTGRGETNARDDGLESGESAGPEQPKFADDPTSISTRLVRYWLVGAMPLGMVHGPSVPAIDDDSEWADGGDDASDSTEEPAGLYREEVVCISTPSSLVHLRANRSYAGSGQRMEGSGSYQETAPPKRTDAMEPSNHSEEVARRSFHLGQVEWAKFRYFDGNNWRSTWDSRDNGQLPVAIEMSLWLAQRKKEKAAAEEAVSEPTDDWTMVDALREEGPEYPQLPSSPSESEQYNDEAGSGSSEAIDDNPMERQPEVRQLVVLRPSEPASHSIPGLTPSPTHLPPRRALRPAISLP